MTSSAVSLLIPVSSRTHEKYLVLPCDDCYHVVGDKIFQLHFNFMRPTSYMWYAIDQNIIMWCTTVLDD